MEKGAPALHSFRAAAIPTDRQLTIIFGREWRKQWRPVGNASPGSGGNFSGRYATPVCGGGGGVCARWSELGRCTLRSSLQAALPSTLPPYGQKMHPRPRVVACPPPDGSVSNECCLIFAAAIFLRDKHFFPVCRQLNLKRGKWKEKRATIISVMT